MTQLKEPRNPVPDWETVRDEWVRAVEGLAAEVEGWCQVKGWPTRRVEKRLTDTRIGEYVVPAVIFQLDRNGVQKFLLDPVARFVPGADGLVDLYRMPGYDDMASVYRRNGSWQIQYAVAGDTVPEELRNGTPPILAATVVRPFTADEFFKVVELMA